jgi:hypothetical protein
MERPENQMVWISIVLVAFMALAILCATLLTRAQPVPAADVEPMKKALERRLREGLELSL